MSPTFFSYEDPFFCDPAVEHTSTCTYVHLVLYAAFVQQLGSRWTRGAKKTKSWWCSFSFLFYNTLWSDHQLAARSLPPLNCNHKQLPFERLKINDQLIFGTLSLGFMGYFFFRSLVDFFRNSKLLLGRFLPNVQSLQRLYLWIDDEVIFPARDARYQNPSLTAVSGHSKTLYVFGFRLKSGHSLLWSTEHPQRFLQRSAGPLQPVFHHSYVINFVFLVNTPLGFSPFCSLPDG